MKGAAQEGWDAQGLRVDENACSRSIDKTRSRALNRRWRGGHEMHKRKDIRGEIVADHT